MILISSCLIGENCRYDASSILIDELKQLIDSKKAIALCPEILGGLPTPRKPCEIQSRKEPIAIKTKDGDDYTSQFTIGAQKALEIAKLNNVKIAILKSKSPSCGCGKIYDGNFTRSLIDGYGITAKLFIDNNIEVYNEENFSIDSIYSSMH